ncbi:hypothetical protein [Phaeobacter gallaeciensis]|uniref:hypothetical protein n=1 Tax=Phaeobacter gallaeciensis TaxID=60890 RepID=UPI00237F3FA0|nr:hypothetical protein [Phaeobacter gallaeciensis]
MQHGAVQFGPYGVSPGPIFALDETMDSASAFTQTQTTQTHFRNFENGAEN